VISYLADVAVPTRNPANTQRKGKKHEDLKKNIVNLQKETKKQELW